MEVAFCEHPEHFSDGEPDATNRIGDEWYCDLHLPCFKHGAPDPAAAKLTAKIVTVYIVHHVGTAADEDGIKAVADVELEAPEGYRILGPKIESPGLWGVESDADADYLREVAEEQLEELRLQLAALGFSEGAISAAFAGVQFDEPREVSE